MGKEAVSDSQLVVGLIHSSRHGTLSYSLHVVLFSIDGVPRLARSVLRPSEVLASGRLNGNWHERRNSNQTAGSHDEFIFSVTDRLGFGPLGQTSVMLDSG